MYNFFKTPKQLILEAKEAVFGNKGCSLFINFIYFLSKVCFFVGVYFVVKIIQNFNNLEFNLTLNLAVCLALLLVSLLTYGPLRISVNKNTLNMVNNTNPSAKDIFYGFKVRYFRNVGYGLCLFFTYIFFLALLIVPYFIKHISTQCSGYLLIENENYGIFEAIKRSSKIMKGHKMTYVKVILRLIPKILLCVPTILIYALWLKPFFNTAICCLYQDIK